MSSAPTQRKPTTLSRKRKLLYSLLAMLCFFGSIEISMRVLGISFEPNEIAVLAYGERQEPMVEWVRPGMWEALPNTEKFNADGFVGPRIPNQRTAGTLRIATMGDSCTQWGEPPYAEILRTLLEERLQQPTEVLNAGVIRYSTEQGLRRLRERVLPYQPDIVTIYFGWNDHWIDYWKSETRTDAERLADAVPKATQWLRPLQSSRTVQLICFFADILHEQLRSQVSQERKLVLRVPPETYAANLQSMITVIRDEGAFPILITAPTDAVGDVDAWKVMLQGFKNFPYADHAALHDEYVEITRQVAHKENVPLVDARLDFLGSDDRMMRDQIHLSQPGHQRMAELIADVVVELPVAKRGSDSKRRH